MIKAILFDMDGVLVDSKEAILEFRKMFFEYAGYKDVAQKFFTDFHSSHRILIVDFLKSKNIEDKKEISRLISIMQDNSLRSSVMHHRFNFDEKLEKILEDLKKKFLLGVVTSRGNHGIKEIFNLRPIEKYFDVIVGFDDVDNHKPHPEPLEKALNKLGLKPKEAIYIGDSDTDILAADSIGMPSIHLSDTKHDLAHHQIISFSEIPSAIKLIEKDYADGNPKKH